MKSPRKRVMTPTERFQLVQAASAVVGAIANVILAVAGLGLF